MRLNWVKTDLEIWQTRKDEASRTRTKNPGVSTSNSVKYVTTFSMTITTLEKLTTSVPDTTDQIRLSKTVLVTNENSPALPFPPKVTSGSRQSLMNVASGGDLGRRVINDDQNAAQSDTLSDNIKKEWRDTDMNGQTKEAKDSDVTKSTVAGLLVARNGRGQEAQLVAEHRIMELIRQRRTKSLTVHGSAGDTVNNGQEVCAIPGKHKARIRDQTSANHKGPETITMGPLTMTPKWKHLGGSFVVKQGSVIVTPCFLLPLVLTIMTNSTSISNGVIYEN